MSNDNEKITLNIPIYEILFVIGIILIILGILATSHKSYFFGIPIWWLSSRLWVLAILGVSLVCGYITHKILPDKKSIAFLIGVLLGVIGIIISICIKPKKPINNINKYETLQRFSELKQNGTITDAEFEIEKSKILKGE